MICMLIICGIIVICAISLVETPTYHPPDPDCAVCHGTGQKRWQNYDGDEETENCNCHENKTDKI
jgi:hypothetical protein